jgi:hypothetical protein
MELILPNPSVTSKSFSKNSGIEKLATLENLMNNLRSNPKRLILRGFWLK